MAIAKKILNILNPVAGKEKDGRDVWPNRAAFILAGMVSFSPHLWNDFYHDYAWKMLSEKSMARLISPRAAPWA